MRACSDTHWVTGILATCKDGGVESVQLSTLHSLTHFIGGEQKMPKSSVGIQTVFDSHFTATVFHYNSCLKPFNVLGVRQSVLLLE